MAGVNATRLKRPACTGGVGSTGVAAAPSSHARIQAALSGTNRPSVAAPRRRRRSRPPGSRVGGWGWDGRGCGSWPCAVRLLWALLYSRALGQLAALRREGTHNTPVSQVPCSSTPPANLPGQDAQAEPELRARAKQAQHQVHDIHVWCGVQQPGGWVKPAAPRIQIRGAAGRRAAPSDSGRAACAAPLTAVALPPSATLRPAPRARPTPHARLGRRCRGQGTILKSCGIEYRKLMICKQGVRNSAAWGWL